MARPFSISPNRRHFVKADGTPFFYLADTAWELLHRLDREETESYLQKRAAQGFTTFYAVILAEEDGLRVPNRQGDLPLIDLDPARPNEKYFAHVDWVVKRAGELGLVPGLLPTWGDKWNQKWGKGPEVFTPENALEFGRFLGKRYSDAPVFWILGGDRPVENERHFQIIRAMAKGLEETDAGHHLRTLHPVGGQGSAAPFHDDEWLDFNMWQSGHGRHSANFKKIAEDYVRQPVKPVLDGEPGYEDHKAGFQIENGFLDDYDIRKSMYWSLLSGAAGYTYGCHDIWQFWSPRYRGVNHPRRPWNEAMDLPGANQLKHARALCERFNFFDGVPAQEMLVNAPPQDFKHVAALRHSGGNWALFFCPMNEPLTLNLGSLNAGAKKASWFDPRLGTFTEAKSLGTEAQVSQTPPEWGPDWILVIEAAG